MSWSELERLVTAAEGDPQLQDKLRTCRDDAELILVARQLGYRVTRLDLQHAIADHQASTSPAHA